MEAVLDRAVRTTARSRRIDIEDPVSPRRAIDAALVGHVLDAALPDQTANEPIDIRAYLAPDAERSVGFRCGVRACKQEHRGVREIHAGITDHANPVLSVAVKYVSGHIGMRCLLNREAVAAVPTDRVADDPGGGSAQHLDAIASIVSDHIRAWNLVVRADDADMHRRTADHENAFLLISLNDIVDDSSKTVVRDLEPADRSVPDGVAVDGPRSASVNPDPKCAAGHGETLDCYLAAEHLDGGTACVWRIDRRLSLTIQRDALDLGLYQQILATSPSHQDNVTRFRGRQDPRDCVAPIAVDIDRRSGTKVEDGEAQPK